MEREAKAKVVASVSLFGGKILFNFLPRLIWKNRMNSTVSFIPTEAKQLARQEIEQNLLPKQT